MPVYLMSLSTEQYADPVSDLLDKWGAFRCRLFRESCVFHRGNYVKDLSRLGRDLNKVIIVDNSPASYIFHPDNAVSGCRGNNVGPRVYNTQFISALSATVQRPHVWRYEANVGSFHLEWHCQCWTVWRAFRAEGSKQRGTHLMGIKCTKFDSLHKYRF